MGNFAEFRQVAIDTAPGEPARQSAGRLPDTLSERTRDRIAHAGFTMPHDLTFIIAAAFCCAAAKLAAMAVCRTPSRKGRK